MSADPSDGTETRSTADRVIPTAFEGLHNRQGRIGVRSHAARQALASLILVIALVPAAILDSMDVVDPLSPSVIAMILFSAVFFIWALLVSVMSSIKRLHDLNHSGWMYLICLLGIIGNIFYFYFSIRIAKPDSNRFGETLPTSKIERVTAPLGFVVIIMMLSTLLAALLL